MCYLTLFLLSLNLSNEIPKINELIITETHFGYHNLNGPSLKQTIDIVYAPDRTPHSYPSWPYMHVYGQDTLFYESDYYVSDKGASYRDDYYYPYHIKVSKDTVMQFIKQIDQLNTYYRKSDGKKYKETLRVTSYDHYNKYNNDSATGIIINNISSKTSFKEKYYNYNQPNYEFILYSDDDSRYGVYYPFYNVKDSNLMSIKYIFSLDNNKYLYKNINYIYGLNNIDGQNDSFITKINHHDYIKCDYYLNDVPKSYNSDFRDLFKIQESVPTVMYCEEYCPSDSLSFFIDSLGRKVKRKTFYVPDDCGHGGYATVDSVFNSKGQLVIEKPGYHYNGTTMVPPYTIKEFRYHDNGQISDIICDENLSHFRYNEKGQILMKKYLTPESNREIYKYNDYGNLVLFSHDFGIGTDYSYSYKNKYEHIYNDSQLLLESYIYYYQPNPKIKNISSKIVDKDNLYKYLIAKYKYNDYGQIIRKEEYTINERNSIPFGNKFGLIHKLTTYEYVY